MNNLLYPYVHHAHVGFSVGQFTLIYMLQVNCIGEESLIEVSTNECICPGNILMYKCTVLDGIGATTIWKSGFFQCSSGKQLIELVHRPLTEGDESNARVCNNGDIVGTIVDCKK